MRLNYSHQGKNTLLLFSILFFFSLLVSSSYAGVPVKIMPLGDSITFGLGSDLNTGYRQPLFLMLTETGYEVDFVGNQENGLFAAPFLETNDEGRLGWGDYQCGLNVYE